MHALNKYGDIGNSWPENDTLFFKFQGHNRESLAESGRVVEEIVVKHGGFGFQFAKDDKQAKDLWESRKNALYSTLALVEGARSWSTDVWLVLVICCCSLYLIISRTYSVPVSNLPELVYETKKDLKSCGLVAPVAGHVGDGNFHASVLTSNEKEFAIAKEAVARMVHRAIALDGTCKSKLIQPPSGFANAFQAQV